MVQKYLRLPCVIIFGVLFDVVDALSFDPKPSRDSEPVISRRNLFSLPIVAGGTVVYGKLLSGVTKKLARGDLAYPESHEQRVKSTIAEALIASIPQSTNGSEKEAVDSGIGRPLRILEVGIGKDCRVVRRGLYDDAFAGASSRGVNDIDLTGLDIVSPPTAALEKAKQFLSREEENPGVRVSLDCVTGSLSSRLDFRDEYFDCVICVLTLCSVDDQTFALNEIKRVLRKDGGSFGYVEHVAVDPEEPYRLLEFQQLAFDGLQQKLADNCHLHRFTQENIADVFGLSEGMGVAIARERFLVDDMWPISCQTSGVIRLSAV